MERPSKLEVICVLAAAALVFGVFSSRGSEEHQAAAGTVAGPESMSLPPAVPAYTQAIAPAEPTAEGQSVPADQPPTSYPATAAEQQAKDALAEPGDWVTPPAFSKSE